MKNLDKECQIYSCILIDILIKNLTGNMRILAELTELKEKQCRNLMD